MVKTETFLVLFLHFSAILAAQLTATPSTVEILQNITLQWTGVQNVQGTVQRFTNAQRTIGWECTHHRMTLIRAIWAISGQNLAQITKMESAVSSLSCSTCVLTTSFGTT